jgi:hypothetical protein
MPRCEVFCDDFADDRSQKPKLGTIVLGLLSELIELSLGFRAANGVPLRRATSCVAGQPTGSSDF